MKLFLHVHTRDKSYKPVKLYTRDEWEESKHPRGQPGNAGQFASRGGGSGGSSSTTSEQTVERTASATRSAKSSKPPLESPLNSERQAKFDKARADIEEIVNPFHKSEAEKKQKPVLSISLGKVIDKVAEAFDYKDRDKIQIVDEISTSFQLDGRGRTVLGNATLATGVIRINKSAANAMDVPGTIAHEIMHQKFQRFLDKADEETKQVMELAKKDNNRNNSVIAPDDTLRPEYKGKFPLYELMHPKSEDKRIWDTQKLMDDDGITPYSREWWQKFHDESQAGRPMSPLVPIHETLAEMGCLEMEGSLQRLLWFKESKSYRPLYEAIQKFVK